MALPARVYLTLHETSARWGCNIADIAGWADAGRFRILTGITAVSCGDEVIGQGYLVADGVDAAFPALRNGAF